MPEEKNPYGKVSRFSITAGTREGQTVLEDFSYTSPFKIMQPFPLKGGGIQVMLLAASAGIWKALHNTHSLPGPAAVVVHHPV